MTMRKSGLRRAGAVCLFVVLLYVAAVGFGIASFSAIAGAVMVIVFVTLGYLSMRGVK